MQLVAAILWGRQYHGGAGAVHPSNLSGRQDNLQYICSPKLASKCQCKIQDTFTQLKNNLSLCNWVKQYQGCMHSSDFIICIQFILFLLCFFCHHAPLVQSTLMAVVWHLTSDWSLNPGVQSNWKSTGVYHAGAQFQSETLYGWSWNSSWMIPKLSIDE